MYKRVFFILFLTIASFSVYSQCAVCKNTISSIDDKSARGMNSGILYLAAMPLLFMGFIGYKWWKHNKNTE